MTNIDLDEQLAICEAHAALPGTDLTKEQWQAFFRFENASRDNYPKALEMLQEIRSLAESYGPLGMRGVHLAQEILKVIGDER